MASEPYSGIYNGVGLAVPADGLIKMPSLDGTITAVYIDMTDVADGDTLFTVSIDGVEIVDSTTLTIADGVAFVNATGLSEVTTKGGNLELNLVSPFPTTLPDPPINLIFTYDFGTAADAATIAAAIHAATGKTTPVDADELGIVDSAASNVLKKLTWANLKATLKTYFDTQYPAETATTAGALINAAGAATPNNGDFVATAESGGLLKKITWTNVKAFLKTYFDTLYLAASSIDDTAYDATTWNGDTTHAPSKNAVRDKIESIGAASISDTAYGVGWDGDTTTAPSKNAVYDKIQTLGGGGTVTHTGGALTANAVVLGAGTDDAKVVAGVTTNGTAQLILGVNTTTLGSVKMFGNTSGDATISPAAVAGTATALTLPATTDTLVGKATTDTLSAKKYSLTAAHGSDDTYEGLQIPGLNNTGGVTQWDAVYLNSSSAWVIADANGSSTYPAQGLAVSTETTGNPVTVLTYGTVRNDSWTWTAGGLIYLSGTAGGLTQTAPSASGDKVQIMGYALDADRMFVNPQLTYITIT